MKNFILFIMLAVTVSTSFGKSTVGNDEHFIYGKITTTHGKEYTGAIRWGKEEVYWTDIFNSSKIGNKYAKYVEVDNKYTTYDDGEVIVKKYKKRKKKSFLRFLRIFKRNYNDDYWYITTHSFSCQFKDLKSILILSNSYVKVQLKNGEIIKLKGGSNDIGASINVYDDELGIIKLKWRMVEKVEFLETPKRLKNKFGETLFGTVKTDNKKYTGLIKWDHDERVGTDVLDGENNEGDYKIKFENIKSISKSRRGSKVKLKSGRELELWGSNDVDDDNKGIVVSIPNLGFVDIQWDEFESVTFEDIPDNLNIKYNSSDTPKTLKGKVTNSMGETFTGKIVYDLDETWGIEVLSGKDYEVEYNIPFKYIKKITPRDFFESKIEFYDDRVLTLSDLRDVSHENDGIVVFDSDDKAHYISWENIKEVIFNK